MKWQLSDALKTPDIFDQLYLLWPRLGVHACVDVCILSQRNSNKQVSVFDGRWERSMPHLTIEPKLNEIPVGCSEWVKPFCLGQLRKLDARYRAATAFKGVNWNESLTVGHGYSELLGLTLAYSAFEFMRDEVFNLPRPDKKPGARKDFYLTLDQEIAARGRAAYDEHLSGIPLRDVLCKQVSPPLAAQLGREERSVDMYYMAEAIRHAFVHGHLAPSGQSIDPDRLASYCRELRCNVIRSIDNKVTESVVIDW